MFLFFSLNLIFTTSYFHWSTCCTVYLSIKCQDTCGKPCCIICSALWRTLCSDRWFPRRHQQNISKLKHDNIYIPSVCETSAWFDPSHYCCCLSSEWKVPNTPAGTGLTNINPAHTNMEWYWKNWDERLILVQNKLNKPRDIYRRMFSPLFWYVSTSHLRS